MPSVHVQVWDYGWDRHALTCAQRRAVAHADVCYLGHIHQLQYRAVAADCTRGVLRFQMRLHAIQIMCQRFRTLAVASRLNLMLLKGSCCCSHMHSALIGRWSAL